MYLSRLRWSQIFRIEIRTTWLLTRWFWIFKVTFPIFIMILIFIQWSHSPMLNPIKTLTCSITHCRHQIIQASRWRLENGGFLQMIVISILLSYSVRITGCLLVEISFFLTYFNYFLAPGNGVRGPRAVCAHADRVGI